MSNNKRFNIISKLNKTDIIKLFENLPIEELKPLVIIENKNELISLIENIYSKPQLQDILYRSSIDVNQIEKKKAPLKTIAIKKVSENDKLYEEMMTQMELKQKVKVSS